MPEIGQDDIERGRLLNELFDRRLRGEAGGEASPAGADSALAAELNQCLNVAADLRPSCDGIDNLIERGLLTRCDDPQYPAELGPYRIIEFVGRGGMGIVLKAYEPDLNRVVALKILRPDLANDAAALTRFTREAKAAATLRHPNIVTIHAVGSHNGTHFIAMEYVPGPSLADVIRGGAGDVASAPSGRRGLRLETGATDTPDSSQSERAAPASAQSEPDARARDYPPYLDPATIREIFRQLLTALAAAHDAGLIHRDVKSSNILLEGSRGQGAEGPSDTEPPPPHNPRPLGPSAPWPLSVKLADFGLARLAGSQTTLTAADSILGTPEYMSPEQARGDADIDHRSDLYSAGVVLYEMLTGRTPFKADTPTAVLHQIIHVDPPDPRTVNKDADPALATLALRLMAKRPKDRLETAAAALAACKSAAAVPIPGRARRVRRRILGAALACALVTPMIGLWRFYASDREITECQIDSVTERTVQVRRGKSPEFKTFCTFPESVEIVTAVEMVSSAGADIDMLVVGLQGLDNGANVVAFDSSGEHSWDLYLHDETNRIWPDCLRMEGWCCRDIASGDLDGQTGDELVVSTGAPIEYPTRVSIIDPRTGAVFLESTFWNLGNVDEVNVESDFFDDGGSAITIRGSNNKLDGFDQPTAEDDDPMANWDRVTFVAILDPDDMNGLGPPRSRQPALRDIPVARPYAYAFLDLPQDRGITPKPLNRQVSDTSLRKDGAASIGEIVVQKSGVAQHGEATIRVSITRPKPDWGGATLIVDRHLNFINIVINDTDPTYGNPGYWRERWRVVIRDGVYVEPQSQ